MKKFVLFLLPCFLLVSCNRKQEITKQEFLTKIEESIEKYKDYTKLNKDFIYISSTLNEKKETVSSYQFAYDSENKLLYEFTLESKTKKWFYFEGNKLITLTDENGSKTKSAPEEKLIYGEDYFKSLFSIKMIAEIDTLLSYLEDTKIINTHYYKIRSNKFSTEFNTNNFSYNYNFVNNLLDNYEINEYNIGNGVVNQTKTSIKYEKFTTNVNKDEFK